MMNSAATNPPKAPENDLGLTGEAPWLGLRSYSESTHEFFFGRDAEIEELFNGVRDRPLTVLFGQSGLGKTSILQAGLIPRLRSAGVFPILIRLVHEKQADSLQTQVVRAIGEAIPAARLRSSNPPTLWEMFHDPECGLTRAIRAVLIIDQFEEIFTLGEEKRREDVKDFLEAVACLVENRPPASVRAAIERDEELVHRLDFLGGPCNVLLAIRDDFLSRLERTSQRMPSVMDFRLELRPLSGNQAFRAVYEPGRKWSSQPIVSRETAETIVRLVSGAAPDTPLKEIESVPPLLSLLCEQLNARRLASGETSIQIGSLTSSDRENLRDEILREFYDACFVRQPAAVRAFVEDHLVSRAGYRESKDLDTARNMLSEGGIEDPIPVLQKLVDQRLLVLEERGGVFRIELTHDILTPIVRASRRERADNERRAAFRRRLQRLAAGAALLAVLVGAGIATIRDYVVRQRNAIQAQVLFESLLSAKAADVRESIDKVSAFLPWVKPELLKNRESGEDYHHKLNTSLARVRLLPSEITRPDREYLFNRLLDQPQEITAEPAEFTVICDELAKYRHEVRDRLWRIVESDDESVANQRLRAASALVSYDPASQRWANVFSTVASDLVGSSTVYSSTWVESLRPIKDQLIGELAMIYRESAHDVQRVAAADILARYAADRPQLLAELVLDADETQYGIVFPAFEKHSASQVTTVMSPIKQNLETIDTDLAANAREHAKERLANRQANAATILLKNSPAEHADIVWPLLRQSEDPRARSLLIHRLDLRGIDPAIVIDQLEAEGDTTIRRALLLCIGEFSPGRILPDKRDALLPKLREMYRKAKDPGIHSSAEWVLRQWQDDDWLHELNSAWATEYSGSQQRQDTTAPAETEKQGPLPPSWYVNSHAHTMVVIRGPVDFEMGSPETELVREDDEILHRVTIHRTFAVAAKPVTVRQFQRWNAKYMPPQVVATSEAPVVSIDWYSAIGYCNWLSKEEGMGEEHCCYEISADEHGEAVARLKADYLDLPGYRLPTEEEMEYVTRAGARTSRFYGESDQLLAKYAWFARNSGRRAQPAGRLKPNDLGFFDVHGNANAWCNDVFQEYGAKTDTTQDTGSVAVNPLEPRIFRGGSFKDDPSLVRAAYRNTIAPGEEYTYIGFRIARTLSTAR